MLKVITDELLTRLVAEAGEKPRKRSHYNVHESLSDPVQKLFVAAQADSYFRPHRHPDKSEFAMIVRGQFEILLFDDDGGIAVRQPVGGGTGATAFEIPANTWHCWLVGDGGGVFFETKQGPYDPDTAAEFAPWAPEENSPEAGEFLRRLRR